MILTLILIVLIWMLPIRGNRLSDQRAQSQLVKFVASLAVVVGHATMFFCHYPLMVVRETSYGQLCVAFFLFMSGYGLVCGVERRHGERLSWNWLTERLVKLVVPALTATVLYTAARRCCGMEIDWGHLLKWGFISDTNLKYGWYVSEILFLYIMFFLCYRWLPVRLAFVLLNIGIFLFMPVMVATGLPVWYIMGLPCFMMGTWLARLDQRTFHWGRTNRSGFRFLMMVIAVVFLFMLRFDRVQVVVPALDKWRYTYLSFYLSDILFVILILYVLMRLPVCKQMLNLGGVLLRSISRAGNLSHALQTVHHR